MELLRLQTATIWNVESFVHVHLFLVTLDQALTTFLHCDRCFWNRCIVVCLILKSSIRIRLFWVICRVPPGLDVKFTLLLCNRWLHTPGWRRRLRENTRLLGVYFCQGQSNDLALTWLTIRICRVIIAWEFILYWRWRHFIMDHSHSAQLLRILEDVGARNLSRVHRLSLVGSTRRGHIRQRWDNCVLLQFSMINWSN